MFKNCIRFVPKFRAKQTVTLLPVKNHKFHFHNTHIFIPSTILIYITTNKLHAEEEPSFAEEVKTIVEKQPVKQESQFIKIIKIILNAFVIIVACVTIFVKGYKDPIKFIKEQMCPNLYWMLAAFVMTQVYYFLTRNESKEKKKFIITGKEAQSAFKDGKAIVDFWYWIQDHKILLVGV